MSTIGFLSCKMLQDEIVYLLQNDSSISSVTVVENGEHEEFIQKLDEVGIAFSLISDISFLPDSDETNSKSDSDFSVIVWNLELGLHEFPKILKEKVYECLERYSKKADGIFLLYGLCGNVLGKVEEDFKDKCPVVILRDPEGEIVDDCIGATIGGRRQYINLLKSFKGVGTFIFTPMYEATIDEFFNYSRSRGRLTEEQIIEMNKFMFESSNYQQIARLNTGLHYTKETDEQLQRFAETYQFKIFDIDGGNQIIFEECYNKLKMKLADDVS